MVVGVGAALAGVIAVQAILFNNAVEVRQSRFRGEVMHAMQQAAERLEGIDAMRSFEATPAFQPWLQTQLPNVFSVVDSTGANSDGSTFSDRFEASQQARVTTGDVPEDSLGFYTFSYQADTTFYAPGGPFTIEVQRMGTGRRDSLGRMQIYRGEMRRIEEKVLTMDTMLQTYIRSSVAEYVPIDERFTSDEVDSVLGIELENEGLTLDYAFAFREGDIVTGLRSDNYELGDRTYKVPIFRDDIWGTQRYLLAQFPESDLYIYRSMWVMVLLSLLFTGGVIATFWVTLRQMVKQKKISNIKSDFINNMTHEFKTPLATINLAIDALNSPKVANDPERRAHYSDIIRRENQRLHGQVEHVLRMSLLDKEEVELHRESIPLNDLIEEAVEHVSLRVESKGGTLRENTGNTSSTLVYVDKHHIVNALVNILDNAIKYSPDTLEITITTAVKGDKISLAITDRGMGMSKAEADQVFDRFYRAQSGNRHDVKGHGLGLAYTKEIVELHGGSISVQTKVGEGSTFEVRLSSEG